MPSAICTLFEGHYHYGVAALVNSLHKQGFRGDIYAGYKGSLPFWSLKAFNNTALEWTGSRTLEVEKDFHIHFLPVTTSYHLTNYKPDFMLRLYSEIAKNVDFMAYFDPDIVIKCKWSFFEKWMSHGVALVHDITDNDMPDSHPVRYEWEQVILKYNMQVRRKIDSYINAGFCGISKKNIGFLQTWKYLIERGINDYGFNPVNMVDLDKTYPFCFLDQDALNITAMCNETLISEMGPSGMDFTAGGWTMSHAVGSPKPWKKNYFLSSLSGYSPSFADKYFWMNIKTPINTFNSYEHFVKKISISAASFISRFYHRR